METALRKIIWAVDPFEGDLALDSGTVTELIEWAVTHQVKIEPVYVLSHIGQDASDVRSIEGKISDFFASANVPIGGPTILLNPSESTAAAAQCLKEHALKRNADLIVVTSHGRAGFPRLSLGSFAETLLAISPTPVLFLNRKSRPKDADFRTVLWATDFSPKCKGSFQKFLKDAKGFTSEIIVLYDDTFFHDVIDYTAFAGAGLYLSEEIFEDQRKWAQDEGNKWCELARQNGFKAEMIVSENFRDVAGTILNAAKKYDVGAIALASAAGPLKSVLIGSEAYRVFRAGEFPVWVYGPRISVT